MQRQFFEFGGIEEPGGTALLKHADRLVRDGKYAAALAVIAKAREQNPRNSYALAYQERVMELMKEQERKTGARNLLGQSQSNIPILPSVEQQMAKIATPIKPHEPPPETSPPTPESQYGVLNKVSERVEEQQKILHYIRRARELFESGKLTEALNVLGLATSEDPENEVAVNLREIILLRQKSTQSAGEEIFRDSEEHTKAIVRHLKTARDLLSCKDHEGALTEIALGLTIDPDCKELKLLEDEIWHLHDETLKATEDREQRPPVQHDFSRETRERDRRVRIHLLAAQQFQERNDFISAFEEVEQAHMIDPSNTDVRKTELLIRKAQHKSKSQKPTRRRRSAGDS